MELYRRENKPPQQKKEDKRCEVEIIKSKEGNRIIKRIKGLNIAIII